MKKCLLVILIVAMSGLLSQIVKNERYSKNGVIDPDPNELFKTLKIDSLSIDTLFVNNIGDSLLDYTASIDYETYASSVTVHENNFNDSLIWTSIGVREWTTKPVYDGGNLDGTPMAVIICPTSGIEFDSYLKSPVIDLSEAGDAATISFDQKKSKSIGNTGLFVSTDGVNWTGLWGGGLATGEWDVPDKQIIDIPAQFCTSATQFRFYMKLWVSSDSYWALDNVRINYPHKWLTLNGGATTSGTAAASGSDSITVGFDTTGLEPGVYTADIKLNSLYSNLTVPVELNVTGPSLPVIETIEISEIQFTSAKIKGNITFLGDPQLTNYGICWSNTFNPTVENFHTEEGARDSTGEFMSEMTALTMGTQYNVRTYATNVNGTSYGREFTFETKNFEGSGTEFDPFLISDFDKLVELSKNSNWWDKFYLQTADINASGSKELNEGKGFSPVGNYTINFTGNYDGGGFSIDSLFINRNTLDGVGLFGRTDGADIRNIAVINADITGSDYVGAVIGYARSTYIENCGSDASVCGDYSVGAIVGFSRTSQISKCFSLGNINGLSSAGGVNGGCFSGSEVSNCYSFASVTGGSRTGGLIGRLYQSSAYNCYSAGIVAGSVETGGLLGNSESSSATNCFWDIETSGQTISAGGVGKTTAEMKTLSTFTNATWDFVGETVNGTDDIWNINVYYNDGYPYLSWQVFPLANPQNVVTSIVEGNFKLDWDDMPDEIGYNVYSSDDPYGEFTLLTTVYVSEYTYTPAESKKFFYITGKDVLKKEPPKVIEIPKKVK